MPCDNNVLTFEILNQIKSNTFFLANPSKAALKTKKKREAKKAKKEQEAALSQTQGGNVTANGQTNSVTTKINSPTSSANHDLTDDPEKNKKIKKIRSVSIIFIFHPSE